MTENTKQVKLVLTVTVPADVQETNVAESVNAAIRNDGSWWGQLGWHVGQVLPAPDVTCMGYRNYETAIVILWLQNNPAVKGIFLLKLEDLTGKNDQAEQLKQWVIAGSPNVRSPFSEFISAGISETDWLQVLDAITEE